MENQKNNWIKKIKKIILIIGGIFIFILLVGAIFGNKNSSTKQEENKDNVSNATETNVQDKVSKDKSQKELVELINLSKQAGVVSSYEFSETANVVYVTAAWYDLDVSFKKDLLGKIASLKEATTGYHRFEVRNVKSNEKVAEVTAFSGSIEIYK